MEKSLHSEITLSRDQGAMSQPSEVQHDPSHLSHSASSQVYSSMHSHAGTRKSFLQSMALWCTARRLYPNDSIREVARKSEQFSTFCDTELEFCEMSCDVCHQHGADELHGRDISSRDLRLDCRFCSILQKCCEHLNVGDRSMHVSCGRYRQHVQICFYNADGNAFHGRRSIAGTFGCEDLHIQLFRKEPDYVYGPFSASNDLSSSPSSDVKLDIMKGWIDTCVQSHDRCRPPANQCVPRRLIHLIDDEQRSIRLHSPATPVQFAALSYRWGPDEEFKTLKENLSARYKILDTSPWPKSLQDSLIIARGLGLQYIWIDAICIVQDDTDDWAEEASNMARIYSTAHVVLSATSAKDSAEGFLKERSAPFLIESQRRDGSIQEYYARRNNSHTCDLVSKRADYPLFERGWCLQERLLARRLIHFLPDEIRYECQVGRECECGVASREYGFEAARQGSYSFPELRSAKSMEGLEFAWLWMSMIWDYSRMHLSEPTDILPAFSGLAACMEHLNPGKYIAGMWEHNIAIQLGWRHDEKNDSAHELQPPKLALHGPTFSWSSYTKPLATGAPYDTQSLILCRLDHADVRLATVNPYGQILEASIRLSGHYVPGDEMIRHLQTTIPKDSERLVQLDTGFYFCADNPISDESLEDAMEWRSVMCFGLYEFEDYDFEDKETTTHTVDVLLLQLKGVDSSEYIRIGVAQNLEPAWFHEHATERTVTIV